MCVPGGGGGSCSVVLFTLPGWVGFDAFKVHVGFTEVAGVVGGAPGQLGMLGISILDR